MKPSEKEGDGVAMKLSERIRYTNHAQDVCRGRCHLERGEIADEVAQLEEMLNELIYCHYGVATHHIGDGDGIPDEMAENIRAYWEYHLGRK